MGVRRGGCVEWYNGGLRSARHRKESRHFPRSVFMGDMALLDLENRAFTPQLLTDIICIGFFFVLVYG